MPARILLMVVCFGLLAFEVPAAAFKGGIVHGEQHAFLIEAPPGWVLDNQSGVSQGLNAVFYPKGSSWSEASAVMYASMAGKKKEGLNTVQEVIDHDLAKFKRGNPKITMTKGRPIKTADGKTAQVCLFRGDQWGNQEAVAYINEKNVVAILVLSSRSQSDFQKSLPAFEKLVASYRFYTDKVQIQQKPKEDKD